MSVVLSRSDFAKGFSAFAVAFARLDIFAKTVQLSREIPAYYNTYLADIIARVNRHRMEDGCDAGFWFLTDLHVSANHKKSGLLLTRLVAETGIRRVVCGGDLPMAFGSPKALDVMVRQRWPQHWRDPLEKVGATVYLAKGNHDCHITENRSEHIGLQYSADEVACLVRECNGNATAVTDADNLSACYCYFDDAEERIRYVIADTSDAPCLKSERIGVEGGFVQMSERQLKWLAEKAFGTVPTGYAVIVVHHVPLARIVATKALPASLETFKRLLESYQNRQLIEIGGTHFDFAKRKGGDIVFDLTGHHHSDRQGFENGILHLSESCDAMYKDYLRRTPFCGVLPEKKGDTIYEQTFDCVQLNAEKGILYITRIGGGQDRVYHLRPTKVKTGEAKTLNVTSVDPKEWKSFDCDSCVVDEKAQTPDKYWTFFNHHVEVDCNGRLVAKSPGPALVVAFDQMLRKEFFPVMVSG